MVRTLADKAKKCPDEPGVYIFKDAAGEVIYVGKAVSLRNRVRSYLQNGRDAKVRAMLEKAADLSFIVTENEVEALVLEANLVKRHRPHYNVVLKDDKSYPYIKVTVNEEFPRVLFSRRRLKDGARYYGPYTRAGAVYETLRFTRTFFPYRSCKTGAPKRSRPCLNYHIRRCPGPCTGHVDRQSYRKGIDDLCLFLEGRYRRLLGHLKKEMGAAAARMQFEKAGVLRDRLRALEDVLVRQRAVLEKSEDLDAAALARTEESAVATVLLIREGRLIGQELFALAGSAGKSDGEVIASFLKQYYSGIAVTFPREVILPDDLGEEGRALSVYLRKQAGRAVVLTVPRRGRKKELLALALKNALLGLEETRVRSDTKEDTLTELAVVLGLERVPQRIEGYDASYLRESEPVASMVVFIGGRPHKSAYRRFSLGTGGKQDDYGALRTALTRRFHRAQEEQRAAAAGLLPPRKAKFLPLPDLILVDGGAGQAAVAQDVLAAAGYGDIPVIGLAKENEWVHRPGENVPLALARDSSALRLLQHVRDEAHRFAVAYQQKRRHRSLKSVLEDIEGVGPVRRRALLREFASLDALKQASLEKLCTVPGMNRKVAGAVYRHFHD